jgi:hypothetical protein
MVLGLSEGIGRICGFATLVLDDIICDEAELLDGAVRRMCTLIAEAANFICDYAKQSAGCTSCSIMLSPDLLLSSPSHQGLTYGRQY